MHYFDVCEVGLRNTLSMPIMVQVVEHTLVFLVFTAFSTTTSTTSGTQRRGVTGANPICKRRVTFSSIVVGYFLPAALTLMFIMLFHYFLPTKKLFSLKFVCTTIENSSQIRIHTDTLRMYKLHTESPWFRIQTHVKSRFTVDPEHSPHNPFVWICVRAIVSMR